jgi:ferredoxin-NADP reductase
VSLTYPAAPASTLAFVTTVHLALAVLRNHRRAGPRPISSLALMSVVFAGGPWLLPSTIGLVVGLGVHTIWFLLCNRFSPEPPAATPRAAIPAAGIVNSTRAAAPALTRPSAPKGFVPTSVVAVMDEAPDIRTFRFARPAGFDFVAGQFLPVRLRIDGRDQVRCYSISSSPESRGYLEISVKRQGLVSNALHATVRPGATIDIKAPAGAFTYPAGEDAPLLFIAGGIGITPLMSMLRHGVQAEPNRTMTLLYSAASAGAFAFRDEIKVLVRRHPKANAIFAVTRGEPAPDVYPGRIDDSLIRAAAPNVARAIVLLCGPQPMIDGLRTTLAGLGVPPARIRSEAFEAAMAVAAGRPGKERRVHRQSHEIRCAKSGLALHAEAGQTLLEAAEAGGVCIDSLCRSGVCGTCRTRVVGGDVECESTVLPEAEREDGYVLACVTRLHGDCVIEA